ncbi:MAG: hypothetical protein ABIM89_18290 [Mycobacteriales bacterium]
MMRPRRTLLGILLAPALVATWVAVAPARATPAAPELLFVRTTAGSEGGTIYRMPVGGGAATPFLVRVKCPCPGTDYDPATNTSVEPLRNAMDPVVAPDGSQLRYIQRSTNWLTVAYLGTPAELTAFGQALAAPAWSPDSLTVAFSKARNTATGVTRDVWTIPANSWSDSIHTANATSFSYSPSGAQIAFVRLGATGLSTGLWIMNADGTGAAQVAVPTAPADPQWSPDGSTIAYVESSTSEIYTVPPAGGVPTKIADGVDPQPALSCRLTIRIRHSCSRLVGPRGARLATGAEPTM